MLTFLLSISIPARDSILVGSERVILSVLRAYIMRIYLVLRAYIMSIYLVPSVRIKVAPD